MKVTVISIVNGAHGTIHKKLVKGLEDIEISGQVETIQTTVSLRSARILRRVLESRGDAVTQTSVENHHLTLVWKALERVINK